MTQTVKAVKATLGSRERGRQYRARLKTYQRQLQQDVSDLRKHVQDMQLLSTLRNQLVHCATHTATAVVERVYEELNQVPRDKNALKLDKGDLVDIWLRLRSQVDTFEVVSANDSPVVVLRGSLRGRLPHEVVHRLYFCVPGNSALLDTLIDRDVTFKTARTLFFGADGVVERQEDETDFASVLTAFAPNARSLCEMLREIEPTGST